MKNLGKEIRNKTIHTRIFQKYFKQNCVKQKLKRIRLREQTVRKQQWLDYHPCGPPDGHEQPGIVQ